MAASSLGFTDDDEFEEYKRTGSLPDAPRASTSLRSPDFQRTVAPDPVEDAASSAAASPTPAAEPAAPVAGHLPEVAPPVIPHKVWSSPQMEQRQMEHDQALTAQDVREQERARREQAQAINKSDPVQREDGSWVLQRADETTGAITDLPAERFAKVDRQTGDLLLPHSQFGHVSIGKDKGTMERLDVLRQKRALQLRENEDNADLKDFEMRAEPLKEQLRVFGADPKRIEDEVAKLEMFDSGRPEVAARLDAARKRLQDFHQRNPPYKQAKDQLDQLDAKIGEVKTRKQQIERDRNALMADPTTSGRLVRRPVDLSSSDPVPDETGNLDALAVDTTAKKLAATGKLTPTMATLGVLTAWRDKGARSVGGKPIEEQIAALTPRDPGSIEAIIKGPAWDTADTAAREGILRQWIDAKASFGAATDPIFDAKAFREMHPDRAGVPGIVKEILPALLAGAKQVPGAAGAAYRAYKGGIHIGQRNWADELAEAHVANPESIQTKADRTANRAIAQGLQSVPVSVATQLTGAGLGAGAGAVIGGVVSGGSGVGGGARIGGKLGAVAITGVVFAGIAKDAFEQQALQQFQKETAGKGSEDQWQAWKAAHNIDRNGWLAGLVEGGSEAIGTVLHWGVAKAGVKSALTGIQQKWAKDGWKAAMAATVKLFATWGAEGGVESIEETVSGKAQSHLAVNSGLQETPDSWKQVFIDQGIPAAAAGLFSGGLMMGIQRALGAGKTPGEPAAEDPAGKAAAEVETGAKTAAALTTLNDTEAKARTAREAGDIAVATALDEQADMISEDFHGDAYHALSEVDPNTRAALARLGDGSADVTGNNDRLATDETAFFGGAEIGRALREARDEPQRAAARTATATKAGLAPEVADFIADQHAGIAAGRELAGIAQGRPVDPARAAVLEELGLIESDVDPMTGAVMYRVSNEALPFMPADARSRIAKVPGSYLMAKDAGETGALVRALVRAGRDRFAGAKAPVSTPAAATAATAAPAAPVAPSAQPPPLPASVTQPAATSAPAQPPPLPVQPAPPPISAQQPQSPIAGAAAALGIPITTTSGGGTAAFPGDDGSITINLDPTTHPDPAAAALAADEELKHAVALLAERAAWEAAGKPVGFHEWTDARAVELLDDLAGAFDAITDDNQRAIVESALVGGYNLYFEKYDATAPKVTTFSDILEALYAGNGPATPYTYMHELARQLVQLRQSGTVTEETLGDFIQAVADWLRQALARLKSFAASLDTGALSQTRLADFVREIESLLSDLSISHETHRTNAAERGTPGAAGNGPQVSGGIDTPGSANAPEVQAAPETQKAPAPTTAEAAGAAQPPDAGNDAPSGNAEAAVVPAETISPAPAPESAVPPTLTPVAGGEPTAPLSARTGSVQQRQRLPVSADASRSPNSEITAAPSVGELVRENMGLAVSIANGYSNIPAPMADIVSAARVALVRAAKAHDPERGSFAAYAGTAIRNELDRLYGKEKKYAQNVSVTLDAPKDETQSVQEEAKSSVPAGTVMADMEQRETAAEMNRVIETLPPKPKAVLKGLAEGRSLEDLAREVGVTKQAVSQMAQRARTAVAVLLRKRGFKGVDPDGVLYSRTDKPLFRDHVATLSTEHKGQTVEWETRVPDGWDAEKGEEVPAHTERGQGRLLSIGPVRNQDGDTYAAEIEGELKDEGGTVVSTGIFSVPMDRVRMSAEPPSVDAAAAIAEPNPTEAQKEAGNYKKGHVSLSGLPITIENEAGSVRSGQDSNGKKWSVTLASHYGYIKGTEGKDADHIDVLIKPGTPSDWTGRVFIVNQVNGAGKFDEHKAVLGATDEAEARKLYLSNYTAGWKGLGSMVSMSFEQFRNWVSSGKTTKPASESRGLAARTDTDDAIDVDAKVEKVAYEPPSKQAAPTPEIPVDFSERKRWHRWFAALFESPADLLERQQNEKAQQLSRAMHDKATYQARVLAELTTDQEKVLRGLNKQQRIQAKGELSRFQKEKIVNGPAAAHAMRLKFSTGGKALLSAVERMFAKSGSYGQAQGVQVWDEKEGKFRLIGNFGKDYWPRMVKEELTEAINNPKRHKDVIEKYGNILRAAGWEEAAIKDLLRAKNPAILRRGDFFGQLEMARGEELPADFYEYEYEKVIPNFTNGFSDRAAQIRAYGQHLEIPKMGERPAQVIQQDLFEQVMDLAESKEDKQTILAMRNNALRIGEDSWWHRFTANIRMLASALLLSNPFGTVAKNIISAGMSNIEMFGVRRTMMALGKIIAGTVSQMHAVQLGTIKASLLGAQDYNDPHLNVSKVIQKFANWAFTVSGYDASERWVRTLGTASAMQWVTDFRNSKNGSALSKETEAFLKRMNVDPDAVRAEAKIINEKTGMQDWRKQRETAKAILRWVAESQFLYDNTQVPTWANSPPGRLFFQFGRYSQQRVRAMWRHTFEPAISGEWVNVDGERHRVRRMKPLATALAASFIPGVQILGGAIITGELFAMVAQALFKRDRDDKDWDVLWTKLSDGEEGSIKALAERLLNDTMISGMLGLLTQPLDFAKAWVSGVRPKNVLEPPASAFPRAGFVLLRSWYERGMPTSIADARAGGGKDLWEAMRSIAPGIGATGDVIGRVGAMATDKFGPFDRMEARRTLSNLRKATRRFAMENDMEGARGGFDGRFAKSPVTATNDRLQDALLLGDAEQAQKIIDEVTEKAPEPEKVRRRLKATVDARQPVRIGSIRNDEIKADFADWAITNLPPDRYQEFMDIQDRYMSTAAAVGL